MKLILINLFLIVSLFSCNTKQKEFNDSNYINNFQKEVPRFTKILTVTRPSKELERQMNLCGSEYIGKYSLKVNTEKTNYLYFVAISNNKRKNTLEIDAVKTMDGCFFYSYDKIDADSFHLETLDIDIVFDKRLSKVLNPKG